MKARGRYSVLRVLDEDSWLNHFILFGEQGMCRSVRERRDSGTCSARLLGRGLRACLFTPMDYIIWIIFGGLYNLDSGPFLTF
jgi:hypothetical protein